MFLVVGIQLHVFQQVVVEMCVLLIRQKVLALISVEYFNSHVGLIPFVGGLYVLLHRVLLPCLYLRAPTLNES
ncbi:unknown protein [Paenibacillus amylolyticus]|uniref:Uncharacterized protein n=1 Tax=Paenibacillus amylolyticus TaxID=1451 RepID=A0A124DYI2_PAEAM|nr:unknown protein [Paenibacillus amylolyticus]